MKNLLGSSALRNASWSVLEVGVYPVLLIITTPFFISHLGTKTYGLWMLINSTLALLDILGFGVNETLIKYIAEYRAPLKIGKINQLIGQLFPVVCFSVVLGVLCGMAFYFFRTDVQLFKLASEDYNLFISVLPIAFLGLALKMAEQFFVSIFKGFERYDLASKLLMSTKISIVVAQVVLVYLGFGLTEMFTAIVCIVGAMLLVEYRVLSIFIPEIRLSFRFNWRSYKKLANFSLWSYLQVVAATLSNQLDKFLIAMLIGLDSLAYYSIGFMVFRQLYLLLQGASSWLFPRVSRMTTKTKEMVTLFRFSNFVLTMGLLIGLALLVALNDLVFEFWLGAEVYGNSKIYLNKFIQLLAVLSLVVVPSYFLMGMGKVRVNTLLDISLKTLNTMAIFLGYYINGIEGMLIGLVVAALIFIPIMYYQLNRALGETSTVMFSIYLIPLVGFLLWSSSYRIEVQLAGLLVLVAGIAVNARKNLGAQEVAIVKRFIQN